MEITFWGVRGSVASASPSTVHFGGNTSCIEVRSGGERLILDAGTGIRPLGERLLAEARGAPVRATLLFSHLHWDHIQGFPFFAPAFVPGTELSLFGPANAAGSFALEDAMARQMAPPSFPVGLEAMAAEKRFGTLSPGDTMEIGPFTVETRALDHPQGCLGYRIEAGGRSMCFATDVELPPGTPPTDALLDLASDTDLLVMDAQYTDAEYEGREGVAKKGWGHSTNVVAASVARVAGVRRLALFHHDPAHDDARLVAIEAATRTIFPRTFAAREGARVEV